MTRFNVSDIFQTTAFDNTSNSNITTEIIDIDVLLDPTSAVYPIDIYADIIDQIGLTYSPLKSLYPFLQTVTVLLTDPAVVLTNVGPVPKHSSSLSNTAIGCIVGLGVVLPLLIMIATSIYCYRKYWYKRTTQQLYDSETSKLPVIPTIHGDVGYTTTHTHTLTSATEVEPNYDTVDCTISINQRN